MDHRLRTYGLEAIFSRENISPKKKLKNHGRHEIIFFKGKTAAQNMRLPIFI